MTAASEYLLGKPVEMKPEESEIKRVEHLPGSTFLSGQVKRRGRAHSTRKQSLTRPPAPTSLHPPACTHHPRGRRPYRVARPSRGDHPALRVHSHPRPPCAHSAPHRLQNNLVERHNRIHHKPKPLPLVTRIIWLGDTTVSALALNLSPLTARATCLAP
eukprot:scaffold29027_cov90-Isochrysis_galbana.AAC.1